MTALGVAMLGCLAVYLVLTPFAISRRDVMWPTYVWAAFGLAALALSAVIQILAARGVA